MEIELGIHQHGPLFNGEAARAVNAFINDAEQEIADFGVNEVRSELAQVLRHPTGYYESRIQTDRASGDSVITDGGVIYGPWLEGVGSRNRSTRFKGYFTFRRTTQKIQARAVFVAETVLRKYLRRMN